MKSRIIATGSYAPPKVVTNHDLAQIMDTNDAWIVQRTGIKTRRFEETSNLNMALNASKKAIQDIDINTLEMIIVCTYTPDTTIPSTASLLKEALGIEATIPCFDLNAACTGFVYGLQVGDALIQSGMYQRILLVGSDMTSRTLDFSDRSTAILFGDGAGAVVLAADESIGIVETKLYGQNDTDQSIRLNQIASTTNPFFTTTKQEVTPFDMNGATVFRFAIKVFVQSVKDLMKRHHLGETDLTYIVSHQANARIIESAARMLKMDLSKFPMNLDRYGNTSAASIPMVLDDLNRGGHLEKGMKIILVAFGGGLTYGASLIEW